MLLEETIDDNLPKRAIEVILKTEDTRVAAFLTGYFKSLHKARSIKHLHEVNENPTYSWKLSFNRESLSQGFQFAISPLEEIKTYLVGDINREIHRIDEYSNNGNFVLLINELSISPKINLP